MNGEIQERAIFIGSIVLRNADCIDKKASYGRIKKAAIGGKFMPGESRHIQQYEKELLELRDQGLTEYPLSRLPTPSDRCHNCNF